MLPDMTETSLLRQPPGTGFRIRPGLASDLPAIAEAMRAALGSPPWNEAWPEAAALARVREVAETPRSYILVAEWTGLGSATDPDWAVSAPVPGYLLAVAQSSAKGFQMRVEEIGVVPAAHRRGLGTALMRRLLVDAHGMGADTVWLVSAADGPQAAFYASLGFGRNLRGAIYGAKLR